MFRILKFRSDTCLSTHADTADAKLLSLEFWLCLHQLNAKRSRLSTALTTQTAVDACREIAHWAGQLHSIWAAVVVVAVVVSRQKANLHPRLLVQVGDVKLPAGRMGHQLVMLLQNLMEALQSFEQTQEGQAQVVLK